ncbi:cytochrome c-type biogenesis protein [Elioraea rosea]|uniref:cytochrome c-type biogenesis protein n=1 Tax=Elioraea rosea TaxID=2492390 RepID=UPI001181F0D7|nr:cytochrome c-type biogenesis protein [Elioraea rosea]
MRALLLALLLAAAPALAIPAKAIVDPREMLPDPAQEERARAIGKELRCLVCQNQSIDDSNAGLARDLRRIVRERVAAGDSNEQVIAFVTDRYGDYVRLTPPLNAVTVALWASPAIVLAFGALAVLAFYRRRRAIAPPPPLTEEERARLARLSAE